MPLRFRKRSTKRRSTRKRSYMYRKRRRVVKGGQLKVVRWSSAASPNVHVSLVGNDTVFSGTATTSFTMSNVNGFGELVSLFDNFRITKVLYRWVITRNPDQATAAGNKGIYPRLVWTHDFNDSAPISRDLIYQRANMKEAYFNDNMQKTRWFALKPAVLAQIYESGVSTAYSPKWLQWLDTSDNAAVHYGIKYAWDNLFAGINCNMEAKIFMECKGIS